MISNQRISKWVGWQKPITLFDWYSVIISLYLVFSVWDFASDFYYRSKVRSYVREAVEIRDNPHILDEEKADLIKVKKDRAHQYNGGISSEARQYISMVIDELDLEYLEDAS